MVNKKKASDRKGDPRQQKLPQGSSLSRSAKAALRQLQVSLFSQPNAPQELERKIRFGSETQLLSQVLDGLSDLFCLMDAEGRVAFVNKAFLDRFNFSAEDLIGQTVPLTTFFSRYGDETPIALENSLLLGWQGELTARKKDGSEFRVHLTTVPARGIDERPLGLICMARVATSHDEALREIRRLAADLEQRVLLRTAEVVTQKDDLARINTQLENLVRELEDAKRKAEEANKIKSQFLTHVSHEMRTPLNSVIGFANLLSRNKEAHFTEQDVFYLNRITGNATHLLNVISQMLDLSVIETGKLNLTVSEVHLEELIRETIAEMRGHSKAEFLRMIADIPRGTQPIEADRQKLKQVLINLLANALKFTERGGITVRVVVDALRRPTRIDVIDTGVGIPQDKFKAIFEAFERIDPQGGQDAEGTGLGLTISQSLCHLMGYEIGVESEFGKGSTFTIHLSRTPASSHA